VIGNSLEFGAHFYATPTKALLPATQLTLAENVDAKSETGGRQLADRRSVEAGRADDHRLQRRRPPARGHHEAVGGLDRSPATGMA
jgi:hypothetical protein